jgi:hypothetical protein
MGKKGGETHVDVGVGVGVDVGRAHGTVDRGLLALSCTQKSEIHGQKKSKATRQQVRWLTRALACVAFNLNQDGLDESRHYIFTLASDVPV